MGFEMPAYTLLRGSTYYVRGSPSSIAYLDGDTLYIIDPGHGGGKVKSLNKLIKDLSPQRKIAVITHYHSDHLEVIARKPSLFNDVIASKTDSPAIENPGIRVALTFGYPLDPDYAYERGLLPFRAPPVKVTRTIECGESIGPLRTVHLPGHTPGQIGVITPDGVFYAADSVFGQKVLERYQLPYHSDTCTAMQTLENMLNLDWEVLVPGHGPIVERGDGEKLILRNKMELENAINALLLNLKEEKTLADLLEVFVNAEKAGGPGLYMLLEQSMKGMLSCLYRQGKVNATLRKEGLMWRSEI